MCCKKEVLYNHKFVMGDMRGMCYINCTCNLQIYIFGIYRTVWAEFIPFHNLMHQTFSAVQDGADLPNIDGWVFNC